MDSFIKYGHHIVVQGSSNLASKPKEGFISAMGLPDNRVYFQDFNSSKSDFSEIFNYRNFVFQIWPKLNHESHKELLKHIKAKKKEEKIAKRDGIDISLENFVHKDSQENMKKFQERVEEENKSNMKIIESSRGKIVKYGTEVQLMHVDSNSYLSILNLCSKSDRSSFRMELSKQYCRGMMFKLLPKYKVRKEGDHISYGEQLLIYSIKLRCFIDANIDVLIEQMRPLHDPSVPLLYEPYHLRHMPNSRYEILGNNSRTLDWKVLPHQINGDKFKTDLNEPDCLYGGALIRIKHTETGCYLSASLPTKDHSSVFTRDYFGLYEQEHLSLESVWEIEKTSLYERGFPLFHTNGSGSVSPKEEPCFLLRHFLSGQLLAASEGSSLRLVQQSGSKEEDVKVCFKCTLVDDHSFLKNKSHYLLSIGNKVLRVMRKNQIERRKEPQKTKFFSPLGFVDYDETLNEVKLGDRFTQENAFQIELVDPLEKKDILYISAAIEPLSFLSNTFKLKEIPSIESFQIANQTITSLIFYVLDEKTVSGEEIEQPLIAEGIPFPERQKMYRQFRIIDMLTDILYYPFKSGLYDFNKIPKYSTTLQITLRLTYRLIKHTIQEYRPNELYAFQWVELFIDQAINSSSENDILAEATLTELIDNNEKILSKIKMETVSNFVKMLQENARHEKYIKLLRALCICNGERMEKNQESISDMIILNSTVLKELMIRLQPSQDDILLNVYGAWHSIEEFEGLSEENDNRNLYLYFISFVNLLADLCLGRNYKAMEQLQQIIPYENCFAVISSTKNVSNEIKTAYLRLIHHLWVDDRLNKINMPEFIKIWGEIDQRLINDNILFFKDEEARKFDQLKFFIIQCLEDASHSEISKAFNESENKFTLEVVNLLHQMMTLGFFDKKSEIEKVLGPLLVLLKGCYDVTTEEELFSVEEKLRKLKAQTSLEQSGHFIQRKANAFGFNKGEKSRLTSRYEITETTIIQMCIKEKILEFIEVFFRIQENFWINSFIMKFKLDLVPSVDQPRSKLGSLVSPSSMPNGKSSRESSFVDIYDSNVNHRLINKEASVQSLLNPGENVSLMRERSSGEKEQDWVDFYQRPIKWVEEIIETTSMNLGFSDKHSRDKTIASLLDLILYEKPELVNKAFEILLYLFSKREHFVNVLSSIIIIEDQNTISIIHKMKLIGEQMMEEADKCELWMHGDAVPSDPKIKQFLMMMESLHSLTSNPFTDKTIEEPEVELLPRNEKMEDENSEFRSEFFKKLLEGSEGEQIAAYYSNQVSPDIIKLLWFVKSYQAIITVVEYDSKSKGARTIKKIACSMLAKYVKHSPDIQGVLSNKLPALRKLLHTGENLNVQILIEELFNNNRELLKDDTNFVKEVIQEIVDVMEQLPNESPFKISLLSTLKIFQKYKETPIKENQNIVVTFLSSSNYKNVMLIDQPSFKKDLMAKLTQLNGAALKVPSGKILDIHPYILYVKALIDVLTVACEGKNSSTESKSQSYFPLSELLTLYRESTNLFFFKESIINFIYHVYLDIERVELEGYTQTQEAMVFSSMSEGIVKEFGRLVNDFNEPKPNIFLNLSKYQIKSIEMLNHYLWHVLIPCLAEIVLKDYYFFSKDQIEKTHVDVLNIVKILSEKVEDTTGQSYQRLLEITTAVESVNQQLFNLHRRDLKDEILPYTSKAALQGLTGKRAKKNKTMQSVKSQLGNTNFDPSQNMPGANMSTINTQKTEKFRARVTFMSKSLNFLTKEDDKDDYLKKMTIRDKIESEFLEMVGYIADISTVSNDAFGIICTVTFEEMIEKLISMFDLHQSSELEIKKRIMGIKALRKLVESENRSGTFLPAAEWDTEDWIEYKKSIMDRQVQLVELGVVKMLCNNYIASSSAELRREILLCSISLLLGGNKMSQQSFLDYMHEDLKNDFLTILSRTLTESFENMKKFMALKNDMLETEYLQNAQQSPSIGNPFGKNMMGPNGSALGQASNINNIFIGNIVGNEQQEVPDALDEEDLNAEFLNMHTVKWILKLLQLFCEGHNLETQDFLRDQRYKGISRGKQNNFIEMVSYMFGAWIKLSNVVCLDVGLAMIEFLIESVQGPCRENQITLTRSKIVDYIKEMIHLFKPDAKHGGRFSKELLFKGFHSNDHREEITNMIKQGITLMNSLIEANKGKDKEIIDYISENIDYSDLKATMIADYTRYVTGTLKLSRKETVTKINQKAKLYGYDSYIGNAFNIYVLIKFLMEKNDSAKLQFQEDKYQKNEDRKIFEKALEFFSMNTGGVEVFFHGELIKYYFPIEPNCRFLSPITQVKFVNNVQRVTPTEKINDLMNNYIPKFFDEMKHVSYLNKWPVLIDSKRLNYFRDFSTFLAVIMNAVFITANSYSVTDNKAELVEGNVFWDWLPSSKITKALGIVQLCTSVIMVCLWLILYQKLTIISYWRKRFKLFKRDYLKQETTDFTVLTLLDKDVRDLSPNELSLLINEELKIKGYQFGLPITQRYYETLRALLKEGQFLYMLFYVLVSLMGYLFDSMWYALHLMDIVNRFETLGNVITAITHNYVGLFLTGLLGFVIIYAYGVFAFYFLYHDYWGPNIDENMCTTLFQCVMSNINYGLRMGGGIGDFLGPVSYQDDSLYRLRYIMRFFFDVSFYVTINVVFLNIIFGIIIDTFAERILGHDWGLGDVALREKRAKRDSDIHNFCFICNLERHIFDRHGEGFELHTIRDHNVFNYVYLIYSIMNKPAIDLNGIESYISEKIKNEDISWFPMGRAMILRENQAEDDEEQLIQNIDSCDSHVAALLNRVMVSK